MGRLFDVCREATRHAGLGVTIGLRSRLSSLGPVGLMMQSSPTVGHALHVLAQHYRAHDGGAIVTVEMDGRIATLGYKVVVPDISALDQIYAMVLGMGTSYMRTMLGPAWRPREVLIPFARPADVSPLRKAFDAPLLFDADVAGLVFPTSDLDVPLATADSFLYAIMLERLQQIEALAAAALPDRVRHLLAWMIYTEGCDAQMLAARCDLSVRTLNRRLAEAGTTLKTLRDEAFRDAACQLLVSTDKPTGEIAAILHYSDGSAFTRAFRRWHGVAPTQCAPRSALHGPPSRRSVSPAAARRQPRRRNRASFRRSTTPKKPMALIQLTDEQIRTWTREQKDEWWLKNVFRGDMPQLTLRSAITGFLLGGLLAAAALYIGAKTGITIGVGLTSVILAFALYRSWRAPA